MSTSFSTSYCSSTRRTARVRIAFSCSGTDSPSGPPCTAPASMQLLEAGDADLEELVEIGARDAQEPHPLEQRDAAVLGLLQARAD